MPSYLADETSNSSLQPAQVASTHHTSQYRFAPRKAHGLTAQPSQQSNSTANDSFDESSTHSTQLSDVSDTHPELNGSMDGLPSGTHGGKSNGVTRDEPHRKAQLNGFGLKFPSDQTIHQQPLSTNEPKDIDTSVRSPVDDCARTSLSSAAIGSGQHSLSDVYLQAVTVDTTSPPPTNHNTASSSHNTAPTSPLVTLSTSTPEANLRNQGSPHRYSSPPLYHPPPPPTSSLHPPGAALKHRHTLEVPKATPARGSRDGIDSAFTSGRFSPTTTTASARRRSLSLARRNTRSLHSELPRDEIIPDEDALRWAEAYRHKRASKRKHIQREDDDRVLVGTKVDENHANWVTAYNMLTGIRVSVSRTNAKLDRPLTDADFVAKQKSTFDM